MSIVLSSEQVSSIFSRMSLMTAFFFFGFTPRRAAALRAFDISCDTIGSLHGEAKPLVLW
ncbi:hypothetical protein D3C71_1686940 [compost metagenome]